jgi:hypothetical protein
MAINQYLKSWAKFVLQDECSLGSTAVRGDLLRFLRL